MPPKEDVDLRLEGRATIGGQEVVRPVVPAEDMMQAFAYWHLVPSQELVAAVRPGAAAAAGGGSPNLRAAAMMLARYVAKETGLGADKTDKFVSAYVAERQAGMERLRTAAGAAGKASAKADTKAKTLLTDNATSMEAVLAANLTPDQVKKARAILGTLGGDTDREVAFLMDAKAPQDKIEKALPVLAKYETAADKEVYSKVTSGLLSRPDGAAKMKELRTAAAKDLTPILGADVAAKWSDRPALGFGPQAAAKQP